MMDRRLRVVVGGDAEGDAVAQRLDRTLVRILVPGGADPWRHQVLLVTLVDLLGRLFPTITVEGADRTPAHPDLPPGRALLSDRIEQARGHGALTPPGEQGHDTVLTVAVGPADIDADLHVDGAGRWSYVGTRPSRLPDGPWPPVPIGVLTAAARAAAHITDAALHPERPWAATPGGVYADALTFATSASAPPPGGPGTPPAPLHALLVGSGSVGGAAVYAFAHTPHLSGTLDIVDPQALEVGNLDRALLADADAATAGTPKASVAEQALEHHRPHLTATGHVATISDYHATLNRDEHLPLVLAAVDTAAARRAIQDCLPLELINAACHPQEITVSGHVTDDGPCVCCLHMSETLDAATVRKKVIARATGIPERTVAALLTRKVPLQQEHLRVIERFRGLQPGSLSRHEGVTLDGLWARELMYGAAPVATSQGTVAVAAPFVTALAGFLLASEALKAAPDTAERRLGPHGPAVKYTENVYSSPEHAFLTDPPRWPTSECLCRSTRRVRALHRRRPPASTATPP